MLNTIKNSNWFLRQWFGQLSQKLGLGLTLSFIFASLLSCATFEEAPQKSNLTAGVVKTQIQKGVTTQAEIVQLLGSPNIVTKDKEGQEVWTYSKQSFKTQANQMGGTLILFSSAQAFSSASSSSFDLIITFNKQDIVKDYSVVSSQF